MSENYNIQQVTPTNANLFSPHSMLKELQERQPDFSLAQKFYADINYFQLDLEHIFYQEWLFVGHSCEIQEPGDFFTLKVGEYPIVVVRDDDGIARAYHNICRHRGQIVCQEAKGSCAKLVCPYHQWTYDFNGKLIYARDMNLAANGERFNLKPIHCEEIAGYVFICLANKPSDFELFKADVESYMMPHRIKDAKIAFESTIVERGNWKLVLENNRECYHCAVNHPELLVVFSDSPALNGVTSVSSESTTIEHWQRCEAMGLPSTFHLAPNGQYRVARVPFINNADSMTMNGRPAVKRWLADFPTSSLGSMLLFHYPNTWNHLLADHALSFRILPLSPTETEVTTKWLVHKDAQEGVDYDLKQLTEVWLATNDADRRIVEGNQNGIKSPAYEPGLYSSSHEDGVIQFIDWYARTMIARLAVKE